MAGTWNDFEYWPSFAVSSMLLLTDGSVLCQAYNSQQWRRLYPDDRGQYGTGTWQSVQSSRNAPLYYASAVLRDGKVIVAGGEYNFGIDTDLNTVDLYDPVADTWTGLPPPESTNAQNQSTPWAAIGDAASCVLPDGRFMIGSLDSNACALFDPQKVEWQPTGPKLNSNSNEESWTLLADGSVLTADCNGHPGSERYIAGVWRKEGALPAGADLVDDKSKEIGPAVLLPDGRVFAIGATGATALFTPDADPNKAGVWHAGPPFGKYDGSENAALKGLALGAKDAPACLLPNGRVLCAVGPVDPNQPKEYFGPTTFFEYDPVANKLERVSDASHPPPDWRSFAPFDIRMLLLPTGEVLLGNSTSGLQIYKPDGAPKAAWRPVVTKCPAAVRPGAQFQIFGRQLNGLSQACAYGDDASMATNYPLVRLTAHAPSNVIRYGRTSYHSTMAVATGGAEHYTYVEIPWDLPEGDYNLELVANGIASQPFAIKISKAAPNP